jgi:hypothetical protein
MLGRAATHAHRRHERRSSPPAASTAGTSSMNKGPQSVPQQPGLRSQPVTTRSTGPQSPALGPPPRCLRISSCCFDRQRHRGTSHDHGNAGDLHLCGQASHGGAPAGHAHKTRERSKTDYAEVPRRTKKTRVASQRNRVRRVQGIPAMLRLHPGTTLGPRTHPALVVQAPRAGCIRRRPCQAGSRLGRALPPLKGLARALPRPNSHSNRRREEGEGTAPVSGRRDIAQAPTEAAG